MNLKMGTQIFKALGNENRLKILKLLYAGPKFPVADIAEEIGLSQKSTSKHLLKLAALYILENEGKNGKVFYSLHPQINPTVKEIIKKSLF